jgi:CubicO group peptidase (beta-lactamase class C family)
LPRLIETVGNFEQDSLTIIRHGKIVADAYYAPYVAGVSHDLRSVTKSVVGTLIAIQLQKGSLDSVDHPVLDLFSGEEIQWVDDRKRAMTVQSLLDMTSGIEWVEKGVTPDETIVKMFNSPDRTAFVLNQPMPARPAPVSITTVATRICSPHWSRRGPDRTPSILQRRNCSSR